MGFGTYDESEQVDTEDEIDEDEAVRVHDNDHDGEVEFESGVETEELIGKLSEMKEES
jgi:hypothetical protein